ncbi:C4-dicarboxylate ABC transporter permease, partial [Halorubrum sp. SP3]
VSISIAVHYLAISDSSSQDMEFSEFFDETLSTEKKVFEAIRFGVPFGILIYLLGIAQYTVMTSALYTVVAMMITGTLMPPLQRVVDSSGVSPVSELVTQVKNTVHGIRRGAIILAPIAIILVVISGVVNLFSTTGIPAKIALLLINISGGVLLFAVLLGMGVAIL